MELEHLVQRYAEGLAAVDLMTTTRGANPRTGEVYLPGLKTLRERDAVGQLDDWWADAHPEDFKSPGSHQVEVPYPGQRRNKCDHVLTTDDLGGDPEWGIEVKYLHLVGNNGKRNDFAVAKGLSPYLKDRSLYHDVLRLRKEGFARRHAVIGFAFGYSTATCLQAMRLHPQEVQRIQQIEQVCRENGGALSVRPLVEFADGILRVRELVRGNFSYATFEAWRHPCGGRGVVFGWEVSSGVDEEFDW